MDLEFKPNEHSLKQCQEAFNAIGPQTALFMNHYELAEQPQSQDINVTQWKEFLMDRRVSEWMEIELQLFQKTQLNKIIQRATTNDRSVGTAQMIKALQSNTSDTGGTNGPAFIYSYVPLNHEEEQSLNVRSETTDIFWED